MSDDQKTTKFVLTNVVSDVITYVERRTSYKQRDSSSSASSPAFIKNLGICAPAECHVRVGHGWLDRFNFTIAIKYDDEDGTINIHAIHGYAREQQFKRLLGDPNIIEEVGKRIINLIRMRVELVKYQINEELVLCGQIGDTLYDDC